MHKERPFDETVDNMKNVGDLLIPYNFPKAPPPFFEDDLTVFKEREVVVDGYQLILHFQKADYDTHLLETLQIYNKTSPFVPFCLVCKLGKRFLGSHHLSLVELFRDNRKIYCWSVCVDRKGRPISSPYEVEVEPCQFEGLRYLYMQPHQVNFF